MTMQLLTAAVFAAAAVSGNETAWHVVDGAWHVATNWSDGVPTMTSTALVGQGHSEITTDEWCAALTVDDARVSMLGGRLACTVLTIDGTGIFEQSGQTSLNVNTLAVNHGLYELTDGTSFVETCTIGTGSSSALVGVPTSGSLDIDGDLTVFPGGALAVTGGGVAVGSSSENEVIVHGRYEASGHPSIQFPNLRFEGPESAMTVRLEGGSGATTMVVGTVTLGGTLTVVDVDTDDRRYNLITAGSIVGDFEDVNLPSDWTYGVDPTAVWVQRSSGMPVEPTSWTDIKRGF